MIEKARKYWGSGLPLPHVVSFLRASKPGVAGSNPAGRAMGLAHCRVAAGFGRIAARRLAANGLEPCRTRHFIALMQVTAGENLTPSVDLRIDPYNLAPLMRVFDRD